jgi:hypothetical protein
MWSRWRVRVAVYVALIFSVVALEFALQQLEVSRCGGTARCVEEARSIPDLLTNGIGMALLASPLLLFKLIDERFGAWAKRRERGRSSAPKGPEEAEE